MKYEPTLPGDFTICRAHAGFRSPWPVRIRLRLLGLIGKAREFRMYDFDGTESGGWDVRGTAHVTWVNGPRTKSAV